MFQTLYTHYLMWKYIMCNICVLYYILYAQYMYILPIAYCTYIHDSCIQNHNSGFSLLSCISCTTLSTSGQRLTVCCCLVLVTKQNLILTVLLCCDLVKYVALSICSRPSVYRELRLENQFCSNYYYYQNKLPMRSSGSGSDNTSCLSCSRWSASITMGGIQCLTGRYLDVDTKETMIKTHLYHLMLTTQASDCQLELQ